MMMGGGVAIDLLALDANASEVSDNTLIASGVISALKLVYGLNDGNEVALAESNTTFENAKVLGITKTSANNGDPLEVLTFGKISDASFNFVRGTALFLTTLGNLSNTPPTVGFIVPVGYSLGNNTVFIKIEEPIEL